MGNRTIFRAGRREPAELIIKQVKVILSFITTITVHTHVCTGLAFGKGSECDRSSALNILNRGVME